MAEYNVKLDLVNCTDNNSNKTYKNDSTTKTVFAAKAKDGWLFKENDGENFYISRTFAGSEKITNFNVEKVSSSEDQQVINGETNGITSDGKYICYITYFSANNESDVTCIIKATLEDPTNPPTPQPPTPQPPTPQPPTPQPPTPQPPTGNLLTYDTSGLTGDVTITDKQGTDSHHFDVTVTGNGDGTFTDLNASYQDWNGYWIEDEPFNVSGNVGTLTVYCSDGDEITIKGKFISGVKELQITNNITNTTAKAVASETNYTVTVEGTANGIFNGTPTITYGGETYEMTVNGQTATIIVPIETESVIINGEYLLGDFIVVDYGLTNCEIVGEKPVKVKTGQSYTFNFKANPNAELTEIQANFTDNIGDTVVSNGTIAEDKQTGTVTFNLTTGATDLTVYANADVVQPPTIKNYGAINVYIVTSENLDEFSKKRFFKPTGESDTGTAYSEVNLGAYVNRIKRIFAAVPVGGDDVLKCGNYNTEIKVKYPDSDVMLLDFGNVELIGVNGNNEDYNAQIQMFIPCRGVVSIDSNYIGKTVNLSIKVNVITGDAVALLSCDGVTFQIESFSLSRDVIYRLGTDLNVVGGEQWNEQILYGLEPYVLITENLTINVPVNNTQENVTVKDVTGFAQFENVNLNAANLLVDEYNDIINQLETGVYL